MPTDRIDDDPWRRLITELRNVQEEQQPRWGDVNDFLIARYLAGQCDAEELQAVERAKEQFPEVRECLELAGEALLHFDADVAGEEAKSEADADAGKRGDKQAPTAERPMLFDPALLEQPTAAGRVWKPKEEATARLPRRFISLTAFASYAAAACLLIAVGLGLRQGQLGGDGVAELKKSVTELSEQMASKKDLEDVRAEVRVAKADMKAVLDTCGELNVSVGHLAVLAQKDLPGELAKMKQQNDDFRKQRADLVALADQVRQQGVWLAQMGRPDNDNGHVLAVRENLDAGQDFKQDFKTAVLGLRTSRHPLPRRRSG